MILVDTNNKPQKTVYYISGVAYSHVKRRSNLALAELLDLVSGDLFPQKVDFQLFVLAVDFLFLIGKIVLNEEGELYAAG
ncbi:ABC-three component system middle component 6 [Mycetocola lacteus]|uniref:ABC-three component system middle component 6 n=1 Tax=Mycetocola lacteus TaxID=76637 RepID=UPI0011C394DF|nr:ABC-three component system middle component 6 [Mycetocola lacteus]